MHVKEIAIFALVILALFLLARGFGGKKGPK
jgi:hypothetical protein